MKKIVVTIAIFLFYTFLSYTQDYYTGREIINYQNETYIINGNNKRDGIGYIIENKANKLFNSTNYKTTNNSRYYSYATGMCHSARINSDTMEWILRIVFPDELERDSYETNNGYIMISMAVSPVTGKVEEVEFWIARKNGEDLSCISIDKFYMLEKLLKDHMVCTLPKEVVEESPTYVPCNAICF